jgi:hypothetical protein
MVTPIELARLVTRSVHTAERDGVPTKVATARCTHATDQLDLVGGRYQLEGQAGGVVERCDAPSSFAVTWEFGGGVSWLTVTLQPDGDDRTTLELRHEGPVPPEMWDQFGPGAVGVGRDLLLRALDLHVDTRAPVDPAEVEYPLTTAGREFVDAAVHGWADAAIVDGDAAAHAHEAASRTVASSTTLPDDAASE